MECWNDVMLGRELEVGGKLRLRLEAKQGLGRVEYWNNGMMVGKIFVG